MLADDIHDTCLASLPDDAMPAHHMPAQITIEAHVTAGASANG